MGVPNVYYTPLKKPPNTNTTTHNPLKPPTVNHPPLANAGANQTVNESATVMLNGIANDPDPGDKLSYSWKQIAGPAVKLSNNISTNPSFTAPSNIPFDTPLKFALTARDNKGAN